MISTLVGDEVHNSKNNEPCNDVWRLVVVKIQAKQCMFWNFGRREKNTQSANSFDRDCIWKQPKPESARHTDCEILRFRIIIQNDRYMPPNEALEEIHTFLPPMLWMKKLSQYMVVIWLQCRQHKIIGFLNHRTIRNDPPFIGNLPDDRGQSYKKQWYPPWVRYEQLRIVDLVTTQ